MNDDELDGGGRGPLWRLVGAAISVMLVSEYIILGTTTLALRALRGVAAEAWRRLLPPRDRPQDAATPGAEAARGYAGGRGGVTGSLSGFQRRAVAVSR